MLRRFAIIAFLPLAACAFQAKPAPVAAVNVYQSYDDKVRGRWLLVVDASALRRDIKPTGLACSAHTYPVDAREAFRASVLRAMQGAVENVELVENAPSGPAMTRQRISGVIRVTAETMQPRLTYTSGFWLMAPTARVDMIANLSVEGPRGRLLGTTAEGTGSADGGETGCPGGADVLGQAGEQAMRRLVTTLAERVANSPRVRGRTAADASVSR
jgi:hypothetical protein